MVRFLLFLYCVSPWKRCAYPIVIFKFIYFVLLSPTFVLNEEFGMNYFSFNIKWDMSWPVLSCGIMNQCELNKAVFYSWKFFKCVPFQVHGNRFILFYLQSTLAWRLQYTLSLLPTVRQLLWKNSGQDLAVKTKSTQAIKLYCVFCRAVRS